MDHRGRGTLFIPDFIVVSCVPRPLTSSRSMVDSFVLFLLHFLMESTIERIPFPAGIIIPLINMLMNRQERMPRSMLLLDREFL